MKIDWREADKPGKGLKRKWPTAWIGERKIAFLQPIDGRGYKAREAHDLEIYVWVLDYSEDPRYPKGRKLLRRAVGLDDAAEMVYDWARGNRKLWR